MDNEQTNPPPPKKSKGMTSTNLRKLGFCGADDSISPRHLGLICNSYPFVEFGILFRPDKEGQPRYATMDFIHELAKVVRSSVGGKMALAAHLCGSRVDEVLSGDDTFISQLYDLGFRRVQINATLVNGVKPYNVLDAIPNLSKIMHTYIHLEFILQKNEETNPLCDGIVEYELKLQHDNDECGIISTGNDGSVGDCNMGQEQKLPSNITMLVDESKGTGKLASSWPQPPPQYDIGYAGGIGPTNIHKVLKDVLISAKDRPIWIDMESSLRSMKDGKDVFDLDKCFECIEAVCELGIYKHPDFLM